MIAAPKIGESWRLGSMGTFQFIGVGRDIYCSKYFILRNDNDFFIVSKDDWYAHDNNWIENVTKKKDNEKQDL